MSLVTLVWVDVQNLHKIGKETSAWATRMNSS
jgi:hypothetical protein